MYRLVLLRHGESEWNEQNLFTGWMDADLDEHGFGQARNAARLLAKANFRFGVAYTSYLKRAIRTLWTVLDGMDQMWVPEQKTWRLNERHYGALQGLNKSETAQRYGEDQVGEWRRRYDVRPPALGEEDMRNPIHDRRYEYVDERLLPRTESLKDTFERVFPYWNDEIVPQILAGKEVLVVAHGNTLRALVKHLDRVSDQEITGLNIPIGEPLVYELDERLHPIRHYYLDSPEEIAAGVQRQVDMGKAYLSEVG